MAKKQRHYANSTKETTGTSFDFVSLLTYCSKKEKEEFNKGLIDHPVSSLLLNQETCSEKDLLSVFPDLRKDRKDSLLYRFDKEEERMGKTLLHFLGGFYILDPSSALISYYLGNLLPKNFVSIDLCAAPGGKTIALDLRRRDGMYLANDISFTRAIEISKNTQRMILPNIQVLSMDPSKLNLRECFDLVILDAPCSGSGMIRKEPKMKKDYSEEKVEHQLPIQKTLLEKAYPLLKKDGILAYSTCSLSTREDEDQVRTFLSSHPDMEQIPLEVDSTVIEGIDHLGYHLIPGIYDGEGIYFTLLRKKEGNKNNLTLDTRLKKYNDTKLLSFPYQNNTYLTTRMYEELERLPFLSPGLKVKDDTDHPKCDFDHAYSKLATEIPLLDLTYEETISYIQGNELRIKDTTLRDGLVILAYQKRRLGLGKLIQGRVKNYLPKGLRETLH